MSRDLMNILGRRVVSSKEMIAFHRFPGSDVITVIPPGQPSGIIGSFLPRGYFEIEPEKEGGPNLYIFDHEGAEIVPPDTDDQSSLLSRMQSAYAGLYWNTTNSVDRHVEYLEEGAVETYDDIRSGAMDLVKSIQQVALVVIALLVLILASKFM